MSIFFPLKIDILGVLCMLLGQIPPETLFSEFRFLDKYLLKIAIKFEIWSVLSQPYRGRKTSFGDKTHTHGNFGEFCVHWYQCHFCISILSIFNIYLKKKRILLEPFRFPHPYYKYQCIINIEQ